MKYGDKSEALGGGMLRKNSYFILVVFLSALGGSFKIVSGLVYGSKAALVDALTSIINFAAALLVYRYEYLSTRPPDRDHHYGHDRMFVGGSMLSVVLYSAVGGAMLVDLASSAIASYRVHIYAVLFATIGAIPYLIAIIISMGIGSSYRTYAKFTVVELVECVAVVFAALGGALVSYLIDLTGALVLLLYLYIEIVHETKTILSVVTDKAPSSLDRIMDKVEKVSRELNVKIRSFRIREIVPGRYYGDIIIVVPSGTSIENAHILAHRLEQAFKEAINEEIDLVVHIEPE